MSMMELPVRPRPLPNESIEGYLLRIVARNGWQRTSQLLTYLGLPSRFYVDNHIKLGTLSEKLGPCLRLEPAALVKHFSDVSAPAWLYEESRALQDLRVRFPRLCPACVNQTGFHWHWTLAVVSHCSVHGHPLWDCCPKCYTPLQWHADLFTGCSSCGSEWEPEKNTQQPEHQQELQKRIQSDVGAACYIQDLSLALRATSRPYNSMYNKQGYWPDDQRYLSDAICDAYRLITRRESVCKWALACVQQRSVLKPLGADVVLWPVKELQKTLQGSWPIKAYDINEALQEQQMLGSPVDDAPRGAGGWIRPGRFKIASVESDLYFQVNTHGVARALGLPNSRIDALVRQGLLQSINSAKEVRDRVFDLRDVAKIMVRIPESMVQPEGFTERVASDGRLRWHGAEYATVLAAALIGRLSATRPHGSTNLSTLWINKKELVDFLSECLQDHSKDSLSAHNASERAVNATESKLKQAT